jgi:hypothetical protein
MFLLERPHSTFCIFIQSVFLFGDTHSTIWIDRVCCIGLHCILRYPHRPCSGEKCIVFLNKKTQYPIEKGFSQETPPPAGGGLTKRAPESRVVPLTNYEETPRRIPTIDCP